MKILLAVDGSPYTKHMLAYLGAHPELLGSDAAFSVLTVVPPVPPQVRHYIPQATLLGHYAEQAEAVLRPVTAFATQCGWKPDARYEVGRAAETLARVAAEGRFDLLVMGSHGHSALGAWALGSVTNGVLSRGKTPVLIVPAPDA
jgi:nucleotide-binding universal stress UspA family protein